MSELFPSPAADFEHPIEILEGCHQRIRRSCALVERIGRHVAAQGSDDEARQAAGNVIRYFEKAGADHHRDEEDDLFPALERLASGTDRALVAALLERLRREHGELDALWSEMRARLEAVTRGEDPGITSEATALFAKAYDRHIEIEEASLFPLARRLLDPASVCKLGASMAARRGVTPPPR